MPQGLAQVSNRVLERVFNIGNFGSPLGLAARGGMQGPRCLPKDLGQGDSALIARDVEHEWQRLPERNVNDITQIREI